MYSVLVWLCAGEALPDVSKTRQQGASGNVVVRRLQCPRSTLLRPSHTQHHAAAPDKKRALVLPREGTSGYDVMESGLISGICSIGVPVLWGR